MTRRIIGQYVSGAARPASLKPIRVTVLSMPRDNEVWEQSSGAAPELIPAGGRDRKEDNGMADRMAYPWKISLREEMGSRVQEPAGHNIWKWRGQEQRKSIQRPMKRMARLRRFHHQNKIVANMRSNGTTRRPRLQRGEGEAGEE